MKTSRIISCLVLASFFAGCDFVEKEGLSYPFEVSLDVRDGLLNGEGDVIQRPEVNFKITSEDKGAVYTMVYSVDGGESVTRSNLVGGEVFVNLNSDFEGFKDYGNHTLKGKIVLDKDQNRAKAFSANVWMKYAPVTVSEMYFSTYSGRKDFKDKCVVNNESEGDFVILYSPVDSYTNVDIECKPTGIIEFSVDKKKHESGKISIPYIVKGIGEPMVKVTFSNGPDVQSLTYEVDCRDEGDSDYFIPALDVPVVALTGSEFSVSASLSAGNIEKPFSLSFSLDGEALLDVDDIYLSTAYTVSLSSAMIEPGEHEISCVFTTSNGRTVQKTGKTVFVSPAISLSSPDGGVISVTPGEQSVLCVGKTYTFVFGELSDDVLSNLRFTSGELGSLEGMNYSALRRGQNKVSLTASEGMGGSVVYDFNQLDILSLDFSVPDLSFAYEGINTSISLLNGDKDMSYTVEYFLNGASVYKNDSVLLSEPFKYTIYENHEGDNKVTIRVFSNDGLSTVWEKTVDVYVLILQLSGTGNRNSGSFECIREISDYGTFDLYYKEDYKFSFRDIPARFVNRFDIVNSSNLTCEKKLPGDGSVYWLVKTMDMGSCSFDISYNDGKDTRYINVPFVCYEVFEIELATVTVNDARIGITYWVTGKLTNARTFTGVSLKASAIVSGDYWVQFQEGDYLESANNEFFYFSDTSFSVADGATKLFRIDNALDKHWNYESLSYSRVDFVFYKGLTWKDKFSIYQKCIFKTTGLSFPGDRPLVNIRIAK